MNKRSKVAATFAALLPILPLIPIFAIFSWANSGQTDDHRDAIPVTECPSARVDGGDGLDTTGCGSLEAGLLGSGSLSTTAEAHNWQITAGSGQVRITVKNDGNSCPHVRVLDSRGAVAEGFEERNGLRLCPGGMITTGFFEFNPSGAGTYFIRVFSPETSGAYWISID